MKRRTHPVQKSGVSPWRRYQKGKGGAIGAQHRIMTPGCMWVDRIREPVQDATRVDQPTVAGEAVEPSGVEAVPAQLEAAE